MAINQEVKMHITTNINGNGYIRINYKVRRGYDSR